MSRCYKIENLLFYPHKNEICKGDNRLSIRPKTAELLLELVKANGQIVSKSDLLERVWSDVVVEDHVIFQSVTELRKLFDDPKTIKTHPRKGYSIAGPVSEIEDSETKVSQSKQKSDYKKTTSTRRQLIATLCVLGLVAGFYMLNMQFSNRTIDSGSIIVLPINNRIEDSGYRWIQYGGMDLLIRQLQPQLDAPVLPTDQVLEVLKREGMRAEDFNESDIKRLFEITGAQLIVVQSLSGYSRDYQLVYSFHDPQGVTRGALTSEDTSTLFFDLSAVLMESLGVSRKGEKRTYQNDFANEIMATAIDHMQSAQYQQAATLFKAVLVTEPKNLSAARMLAKSLVYQGSFAEAENVAADGAKLAADMGEVKTLGRLLFWQGLSITQQKRYEEALTVFQSAKAKSEKTNDLLYLANQARVVGKIYLMQDNFNDARASISEALSFYQAIQEPYGQASLYIDLGELELATQNWNKAQTAFETALAIANTSRLQQLIVNSRAWLEKVQDAKTANSPIDN